jgi:hypothetical protein
VFAAQVIKAHYARSYVLLVGYMLEHVMIHDCIPHLWFTGWMFVSQVVGNVFGFKEFSLHYIVDV